MIQPAGNTFARYLFLALLFMAAVFSSTLPGVSSETAAYGADDGFFLPAPPRVDLLPGETVAGTPSPAIGGINVSQTGGDTLQVRLRGRMIPAPRQVTAPGESKLVIQFDRISFLQGTDKYDWWDDYDWDIIRLSPPGKNNWWEQYDTPLLNRVNAEKYGDEGVRLTFTTTKPVVLDSVEGIAGSDNIIMILKAYSEPKPAPPAPQPQVYEKGDPMGIKSPVTLQLRDIDAKSVFRMLADIQKLNVLLDQSVPDMTIPLIVFNGIPFNEAFSYILRMTDLTYAMRGNTLIVGKPESLGKTLGTEITRAYSLSYAIDETGLLKGDLTAALTGLIPLSKPPTLDPRNRTLYVTATPEQHTEVAALLEKLDHPGKQVMLQARIVQVTDDARQDLQQVVSAVYDQWLFNFAGGTARIGYARSNAAFEPSNMGLGFGGAPSDTTLSNVAMDTGLKLLTAGLQALEASNKGKTLANPSLITIDGKESTVNLKQNIKYPTGVDANGNRTYGDIEYGPELTFLPVVGRNGIITINVHLTTSNITWVSGSFAETQPQTSNREVNTTVRVRNGEPFVVGGLYEDIKTANRNRIPVLGYIPFLGDMFTTRNESHNKNEVAMIVIPYILDVPDEEIDTFDLQGSSLSLK